MFERLTDRATAPVRDTAAAPTSPEFTLKGRKGPGACTHARVRALPCGSSRAPVAKAASHLLGQQAAQAADGVGVVHEEHHVLVLDTAQAVVVGGSVAQKGRLRTLDRGVAAI